MEKEAEVAAYLLSFAQIPDFTDEETKAQGGKGNLPRIDLQTPLRARPTFPCKSQVWRKDILPPPMSVQFLHSKEHRELLTKESKAVARWTFILKGHTYWLSRGGN